MSKRRRHADPAARPAERDDVDPAVTSLVGHSNRAMRGLMANGVAIPGAGGNHELSRLLDAGPVQPKLAVSSPHDRAEQEADEVSRQLVAAPPSASAHRASGDVPVAHDEVEADIARATRGGATLPAATRDYFEPRYGHDLGAVRVHTDASADRLNRQLGARAFTTGTDILFRAGEYDPGGAAGRLLLAHELTHVVQQRGSGIHRAPGDAKEPADQSATGTGAGADFVVLGLDRVRSEATVRAFKLGGYAARSLQVVDRTRARMMQFSQEYEAAYEVYADKVREAKTAAESRQEWVDIFAGIAIGVGVGLLAEVIVAEAALTLAQKAVIGLVGESAEAGVGALAKKVIPQVAGQDLEPGGIHPNLMRSNMWKTLSTLYRSTAQVQQTGWHLPLLLGNAEYALGQWRLLNAGGAADMTRQETFEMAAALAETNAQMRGLDAEVDARMGRLDEALTRLDTAVAYPPRDLEQDIWIVWIAEIPTDRSDDLDNDTVEEHLHGIGVLGGGSRLKVDFGWWTSEDDEQAAIRAARAASIEVRQRFDAITGSGR